MANEVIKINSQPPARLLKRRFYGGIDTPSSIYRKLVQTYADSSHSVIDIGCGYAAPDLERIQGKSLRKVGLDVVDEFRGDESPSVSFVKASCELIPFSDDSFDLAISKSVLEHLETPDAAFREVARVLKPGGKFIFLTPNWFDYVSIAASLIPNRFHPWVVRRLTGRDEEDTFPTRYRANTSAAINRLCRRAELDVVDLRLLRQHPHYLAFNIVPYVFGVAYEQSVQRFVPPLRPWMLSICQKRVSNV